MNTKNYPSLTQLAVVFLGLTVFLCSGLAFAQDKKPAELQEFFTLVEEETAPVTTGTSRPLKQQQIPASITVITADEIKLLGLRNLTDVINLIVPGGIGDIHRSTRTGLYAFRGITVDNNGKYVFMVDGLNVGDLTQWGAFNERYLGLMDELDRIEIIQGTGSVLYGSGAISGIINFITKTGKTFQGTELTGGYGLWEKVETSIKTGKQAANDDQWTYFFYGGYKNSQGTTPTGGEGTGNSDHSANGRQWDHFNNSGKFHANLTKGDFTLRMRIVRDRFEEPYSNRIVNTSDCYWFENYAFIQPEITKKLSDVSSLKANISFVANETGMEKIDDWYKSGNLIIARQHNQNTSGEQKIRSQVFYYYDGFANHKLTSGLEGFWMHSGPDFLGDDYSISASGSVRSQTQLITPQDLYFGALFFEDIWKWNEKTTLFAGARYESHNLVKPNISPRIAVSYDYSEKTNFKLLYNRGFRNPDWVYYSQNQKLIDAGSTVVKMPTPETVDSFEAHATHIFDPKFSVTTIGYYTIYHDLINYWTDSTVSPSVTHGYYNYPKVKAAGLEVTADYKTEGWRVGLSHSYSKPVDLKQDNFNIVTLSNNTTDWAQFPTNMTKAHAVIHLVKDKCLLGLTYLRIWGIDGMSNPTERVKAPANYLNATLTFKLNKNAEMQLSGYNLLGEDHPWFGAATTGSNSRDVDVHMEWFARFIVRF